jgi:hypothetical protein
LLITEAELKLIAKAAIIGDNSQPVIGKHNPAAIGMPIELYAKANHKFCFMLGYLCFGAKSDGRRSSTGVGVVG